MNSSSTADRRLATRLHLVGLACWLAALCLLALAAFYGFVAAGAPGVPTLGELQQSQDAASMAFSAMLFLALAALLGVCGYGAFRHRRWAPGILKSVGWTWALTGLLFFLLTIQMLDGMVAVAFEGQVATPEMTFFIKAFTLTAIGAGGIALPTLLLVGSHGVRIREFCRRIDPSPSFTDTTPDPVLGLSLALTVAAVMILPSAFTARIPIGSQVISGSPAVAASLTLALFLGLAAWWTFKLQSRGWWLTLGLVLLLGVSALITLRGMTVTELFEALGYPEQSLVAVAGLGRGWLAGCTIAVTIGGVLQLLWVRSHFDTSR